MKTSSQQKCLEALVAVTGMSAEQVQRGSKDAIGDLVKAHRQHAREIIASSPYAADQKSAKRTLRLLRGVS